MPAPPTIDEIRAELLDADRAEFAASALDDARAAEMKALRLLDCDTHRDAHRLLCGAVAALDDTRIALTAEDAR